MYPDATYLHVRNATSHVVSMAVVVATAVTADGAREVLGLDVGDSEDEVFWPSFLTGPKKRVGHLPVAHGNGDRNAQDPWKHTTRSSYLQSSTG